MSQPPIVSVVMAAYNGAALLPETIASLQAQTFVDFEVMIVDDHSTDNTRDVLAGIRDPRFRIVESAANQGPVRTRNEAVSHARGRYIAGLDQDDLCVPERLSKQVAYLDAHRDTVLLATGAAFLENGRITPAVRTGHTTPALIEWLLHIENPLVWSSVMMRADAVGDTFTDPARLYAEDFDLYHRMARKGRIARLDEDLLIYRVHAGGASQRFTDTMHASARGVLADAYAPLFGDDAPAVAALILTHMMAQQPVPDRATLIRLGEALTRLQARFFESHEVDLESRKLIRWETARRWGHAVRCALRNGTIRLSDALLTRPDHLGLGHAGFDDLFVSSLIGEARKAKQRLTG